MRTLFDFLRFPLVEVVRRTIAARMWSIVSSHRTTCMTHFRVHVYRLTWNIYSTANRVQPNPPFRQPFADLPPDRPRHPPVSSSPPFPSTTFIPHYFQSLSRYSIVVQSLPTASSTASSKIFSPSIFHSISRYLSPPPPSSSSSIEFVAG